MPTTAVQPISPHIVVTNGVAVGPSAPSLVQSHILRKELPLCFRPGVWLCPAMIWRRAPNAATGSETRSCWRHGAKFPACCYSTDLRKNIGFRDWSHRWGKGPFSWAYHHGRTQGTAMVFSTFDDSMTAWLRTFTGLSNKFCILSLSIYHAYSWLLSPWVFEILHLLKYPKQMSAVRAC